MPTILITILIITVTIIKMLIRDSNLYLFIVALIIPANLRN